MCVFSSLAETTQSAMKNLSRVAEQEKNRHLIDKRRRIHDMDEQTVAIRHDTSTSPPKQKGIESPHSRINP